MTDPSEIRHTTGRKDRDMAAVLPGDPVILLSVVNTKLRDYYTSFDAMCDDMQIEKDTVVERLRGIDYEYDAGRNQFI